MRVARYIPECPGFVMMMIPCGVTQVGTLCAVIQ